MNEKLTSFFKKIYGTRVYSYIENIFKGWLVEILSGILLMSFLTTLFIHIIPFVVIVLLSINISLYYENYIDPHKWDVVDFIQREIGILSFSVVFILIRGHL